MPTDDVVKHKWSAPYYGVSHLTRIKGNPRWASIDSFDLITVLTCWYDRVPGIEPCTPGYGFLSDQFVFRGKNKNHDAKAAGEKWLTSALKPT